MEINVGWVLTVLRDRGFPLPDRELLRTALGGIDENAKTLLSDALAAVQRGTDEDAQMEKVVVLGRCLSVKVKAELTTRGIDSRPSTLLLWALNVADWSAMYQKFLNGDAEIVEQVRLALGPIQSEVPDLTMANELDRAVERVEVVTPTKETNHVKKGEKAGQLLGSFADESDGGAGKTNMRSTGNHHVYGKSAAITVEIDVARADENTDRKYTLRFEGAKAKSPGVYVWEDKVIFQLTRRELHQAAAVMLGISPGAQFKSHGDGKDKWFEIEVQAGGVFMKVGQGTHVIAVPVGKEDLFEVALLATRAIFLNDPDIEQGVLMDVLRLTARVVGRESH
jgi:hypothetical protein